ncbi:MAG TPA: hypothetical protein VGL94_24355 [Ktedonobacteraceae bacterium]
MQQTAKIALERAGEGQPEALLFGAGNGLDTPLQEIASEFRHVTVVEVNRESTENAIRQLPQDLQEKFTLVVADITGIDADLCKSAQEHINDSDSRGQFFNLLMVRSFLDVIFTFVVLIRR